MAFSMQQLRFNATENATKYVPNEIDALAQVITRLAGDSITLGDDEFLAIAVARAGAVDPVGVLTAYASSLLEASGSGINCSFDPFGDASTRGYLRNHYGVSDPSSIKKLEHLSFTLGIDRAHTYLASKRGVGYSELLGVHRLLFQPLYTWAGVDRSGTAPALAISKGAQGAADRVTFATAADIPRTIDYALRGSQDKRTVRDQAGTILGNLAYAHPFLDGNGRALLTFFIEICHRSGFAISWADIDTRQYLSALSEEINRPGVGYMNDFLGPYILKTSSRTESISISAGLK